MLVWCVFVGGVLGVWVKLGGVGVVVVWGLWWCGGYGGVLGVWWHCCAVVCVWCGGVPRLWGWDGVVVGCPGVRIPPGMFNAPPPVCCGGVGQ